MIKFIVIYICLLFLFRIILELVWKLERDYGWLNYAKEWIMYLKENKKIWYIWLIFSIFFSIINYIISVYYKLFSILYYISLSYGRIFISFFCLLRIVLTLPLIIVLNCFDIINKLIVSVFKVKYDKYLIIISICSIISSIYIWYYIFEIEVVRLFVMLALIISILSIKYIVDKLIKNSIDSVKAYEGIKENYKKREVIMYVIMMVDANIWWEFSATAVRFNMYSAIIHIVSEVLSKKAYKIFKEGKEKRKNGIVKKVHEGKSIIGSLYEKEDQYRKMFKNCFDCASMSTKLFYIQDWEEDVLIYFIVGYAKYNKWLQYINKSEHNLEYISYLDKWLYDYNYNKDKQDSIYYNKKYKTIIKLSIYTEEKLEKWKKEGDKMVVNYKGNLYLKGELLQGIKCLEEMNKEIEKKEEEGKKWEKIGSIIFYIILF